MQIVYILFSVELRDSIAGGLLGWRMMDSPTQAALECGDDPKTATVRALTIAIEQRPEV